MNRQQLLAQKRKSKRLYEVEFKALRKQSLPKPFDKLGGSRVQHSGLIDVAEDSAVLFVARDGDTLERRAFYAHWLLRTANGLLPLAILHYHPSHKGVHLLTNCRDDRDYTERQLPGAPELALNTPADIDPGAPEGRLRLVNLFCERCGICLGPDHQLL